MFVFMLFAQVVSGGLVRPSNPVSSDVAARRQAIRSAPTTLDKAGPDLLPLIESSLQDADAQVRFSAIAKLTELHMNIQNAARGGQTIPKQIDPRGRASMQSVLLKALNDSDFRIRGGAAKALVFVTNPPGPDIRTALISAYHREPDAGVRGAIISEFGIFRNPESPDAQQVLVEALSDVSPQVRRTAAMGVAKFHPPAALPRIVGELQTGLVETRSEFVHALTSYGAAAKPYVPVLETALRHETRESYRRQIERAITTIQESR
jgi:HEAT repeat protein